MAIRVQHGKKRCARFISFQFLIRWAAHFQDNIRRFGIRHSADPGTGCGKLSIGNARFLARAFFNHNIKTEADKFLHRLRRRRDTAFIGVAFFGDI